MFFTVLPHRLFLTVMSHSTPGTFIRVGLVLLLALGLTACSRTPPPPPTLKLTFTYGSEKQDWVNAATAQFNAADRRTATGKRIQVDAIPMGSGELVREVLDGKRKPDLVSPASGVFVELANDEYQERVGKDLIGPTRNLVLSPVVIAMWKPMAEALGWPAKELGWGDIITLADDPKGWASYGHPEWGRFKLGHTHPYHSNSGILSLLAEVYAATGKTRGLRVADVQAPATVRFVSAVERSIVHYGRSTGFFGRKLTAHGPKFLSAAVLYESIVIASHAPGQHINPPLVAIYPKEGTFWSDHPVGIVQREWVTPERAEAAKKYIDFLLARPQQEQALSYGFRPADVEVPLGEAFAGKGVDIKQPRTTLKVPSAKVLRAVLGLWKEAKKKADLVLVLDVSGSMKGERLTRVKAGAHRLVESLGDGDRLSLLAFNDRLYWLKQGIAVRDGRQAALGMIDQLDAGGGTALYDAVFAAYSWLREHPAPDYIEAVVVLTDGADTNSSLGIGPLLQRIRLAEDSPIRIFPIGYGADASRQVMQSIADTTQVSAYEGDPQNIDKVFADISTFF
jgi:Ca-activated chloride channel homolog